MVPPVPSPLWALSRRYSLRSLLFLWLLLRAGGELAAQISGVVNQYAPVTAINSCTITVPSTSGFQAGDRILIIQMQGAIINTSNDDGFGSLVSYQNAGNFEFATISGVTPTVIAVRNRLVKNYLVAGKVQVVRVASYINVLVGGVTCPAWDGTIGGVVAIEVAGTMTMGGDINVAGKGFRGGGAMDMNLACGGAPNTGYGYPNTSLAGAQKGEGITILPATLERGRGAAANAGGGGNNHNGGGGGGGNVGGGGSGGSEWNRCSPDNMATRGRPAYTLDYITGVRAFMGGGGGAGHANNGSGTSGGNGGGIVIIRAGSFMGNNRSIIADGDDVPLSGPPGADGCGGGGGGGLVILDVANYTGVLNSGIINVSAKGGAGGSTWWGAGKIGPGGGGGGGGVWTSNSFPTNIRHVVSGGVNGVHTPNGDPWGADAGRVGAGLSGLIIPEGTQPTVSASVNPSGPITICEGESITLTASPGFVSYQWSPNGGTGQTAVVKPAASGPYSVTARAADGCIGVASVDVVVIPRPVAHAGPDVSVCAGLRRVIGQLATGGTPPYTYSWQPSTGLNDAAIPQPLAGPTSTTTYIVTVGDSKGECISRDTMVLTVHPPLELSPFIDVTICNGDSTRFGAFPNGGTAPYTYAWTPKAGLNDSTAAIVTASPVSTTAYMVKVTDANGCTVNDTVIVNVRPPLNAAAGPDASICPGDSASLTASGGISYAWSPSAGLDCASCRNPKAGPMATTLYTVMISDADGCTLVDSVLVQVQRVGLAGIDSLDFGALEGCETSDERSFMLHNTGVDTLYLDSMSFNAEGFGVIAPQLPIRIAGGDSVMVRLQFLPLASGVSRARLRVHGHPCGISSTIELRGEKSITAVTARPGTIAFGELHACDPLPADTTAVIYNTGAEPLLLEGTPLPAPFEVISPSFPQTVEPGDSLTIALRYAPTAEGDFASQLKLPFRTGTCIDTLRLLLGGRYLVPKLAPVASVSFGELVGCESERDTIITLRNTSGATIVVGRGDIPAGFQLRSSLPVTIDPGAEARLTVRFAPQQAGKSSGRLLLFHEPCDDTLAIDLDGTMWGASYAMADTIDFGEIPACAGAIATRMLAIMNSSGGGVGASVGSVTLTGPFTTAMRSGDTLPNGEEKSFAIIFAPISDGDILGTMEITIAPCGLKKSVVLKGAARDVAFAGDLQVDFGSIVTGNSGAATATYRNSGAMAMVIDSITPPGLPFTIVSTRPSLPAALAPGETLFVDLRYDARLGRQLDSMRLHGSPCSRSLSVAVLGEGLDRSAWAAISLPALEAAPGERIRIPLMLDSSNNLANSGASRFAVRLRFNRTMLIPAGATPIGTIVGNERVITLEGVRGDTIGEIARFDLIAALGDAEETPLTLEQFEWQDGGPVLTTVTSGIFRVRDLCLTGNTRLIDASGTAALKPVRPNPASGMTEIEYEVMEVGRTELYLVDLLGRRVVTLVDGAIDPGGYVATFDASTLPSGLYFCVLQTGVDRFTQGVRVGP